MRREMCGLISLLLIGSAIFAQTPAGLPVFFERNVGQADGQISYLSRQAGYVLYFTPEGVAFQTRSSSLKMRFLATGRDRQQVGLEPLPGRVHYLLGNHPDKWLTDVPTYARVAEKNVYPGIDLVYYSTEGQLE